MFFEILHRYAAFFEQLPEYIPQALKTFLDGRGLHHEKKYIRVRVNYLFMRFIKLLRGAMGGYVESILPALAVMI